MLMYFFSIVKNFVQIFILTQGKDPFFGLTRIAIKTIFPFCSSWSSKYSWENICCFACQSDKIAEKKISVRVREDYGAGARRLCFARRCSLDEAVSAIRRCQCALETLCQYFHINDFLLSIYFSFPGFPAPSTWNSVGICPLLFINFILSSVDFILFLKPQLVIQNYWFESFHFLSFGFFFLEDSASCGRIWFPLGRWIFTIDWWLKTRSIWSDKW